MAGTYKTPGSYRIAGAVKNGRIPGYDPYKDIENIYNLKGQWETANRNGDDVKKNEIARKAQAFYAPLRANGYGDAADQLTAANYDQAKHIKNYYSMLGKTSTRPYLHDLGKKYGLSAADTDKLISWNGKTGEVGFGGINLGKPDTVSSDGVSYWNDTSKLDDAFNAYVQNAGLTKPKELAWNYTLDNSQNKGNEAFKRVMGFADSGLDKSKLSTEQLRRSFDYADQNLTGTDEFKGIWKNVMPGYEYAADKAGYNASASGASTNGGNVDSYAAANARRQREASLARGQQLAAQLGLQAYQTRSDAMRGAAQDTVNASTADANNAYTIAGAAELSRNGDRADAAEYRQGMNDEASRHLTEANAEQARASAAQANAERLYRIGEITGEIPMEAMHYIYPNLVNADGTLNDAINSTDLLNEIERLKADNKDGRNDALINAVSQLRYRKIMNNLGAYGQYLGQGSAGTSQFAPYAETRYAVDRNAEMQKYGYDTEKAINSDNNATTRYGIDSSERMNSANNASAESINVANNASAESINAANNASAESINAANNQNALDQINATADATIKVGEAGYGTSATTGKSTNSSASAKLKDSDVNKWAQQFNNEIKNKYGDEYVAVTQTSPGYYKTSDVGADYILNRIYNAQGLTPAEMYELAKRFGISDDTIDAYARDNHYNK